MNPLDIQCGVCGAKPGVRCATPHGRLHITRVSAAKRNNKPPHSGGKA